MRFICDTRFNILLLLLLNRFATATMIMVLVVIKEMKVTLTVQLTIIKLQPVVRHVIYKETFNQLLLK